MNGWPLIEAIVRRALDTPELAAVDVVELEPSLVAAALCAELGPNPYRRGEEDAAPVD